ncbi:MAG: 30S ribosomal protein S16 [Candidatus Pacebacteria bacterium]|nr:30S ribosomal protein S16 [Candidatus Paceibacterota bacterium]MDD4831031.1 30S ribosomal protein S16 [Candidatus Paceibacterota bacterium]MDD4875365.1 30S ribosomal protein S16 [Candidatus Paceibacterota bacterium]
MLTIRFFRTGKKNQACFKIVVTEKTKSSTRGRFTEEVGFYNPVTKEKILKNERITYWISRGAKPSDTVYNLLVSEKVIEGGKRKVALPKKVQQADGKEKKEEKAPESKAPAAEAPAEKKPAAEAASS